MAFATNTTVPVERTKADIERLIVKTYKCESFQSGVDFENGMAVVQFRAHGRFVRFMLSLPRRTDKEIRLDRRGFLRSTSQIDTALDQATRSKWRALLLVVKAKLEAVDSKIATFEEEFMAHIVLPNDQTVAQIMTPYIDEAYRLGQMPSTSRLLEAPKEK